MDPLEIVVAEAWERVIPGVLADPAELAARLARRRSVYGQKPPRAWCLAVRASDRRMTAWDTAMAPEDGARRRVRHEVVLDAEALRRLCGPVRITAGGEEWT